MLRPKTARGKTRVHEGFMDSLGTMTRNFEMMAAGKLLASGSTIRLGDLRNLGKEQNKLVRSAMRKGEPKRTKNRRKKGTTKADDSDDEDTAFVMRAMGLERETDKEIMANAEAKKRRKAEGGSVVSGGGGGGGGGGSSSGRADDGLAGAASFEAFRLAQMVRTDRVGPGAAPAPAAAASSSSSAAAAVAPAGFADATATGGSAFSLGGF